MKFPILESRCVYTVRQLAKLSGVSVRTLHYYDEIDLLSPAYVGENGYRYYEEKELLRLQQILFFRELGFPLAKIQKIVGAKSFDKLAALASHKVVLEKELKRIRQLIKTVDKTMNHLKGEIQMKDQEMYHGFSDEKQKEYEKYLIDRYGEETQKRIEESKEKCKHWTKKQHEEAKKEVEAINKALADAIEEGCKPDSAQVQELIARHYKWLSQFYDPKGMYARLGQLYAENPDFRKYYDKFHPKLADFLAEAMKIYS